MSDLEELEEARGDLRPLREIEDAAQKVCIAYMQQNRDNPPDFKVAMNNLWRATQWRMGARREEDE